MGPKVYSFLRDVESRNSGRKSIFRSESARRVKTLDEINKEITKPKIRVKQLEVKHIKGERYLSPGQHRKSQDFNLTRSSTKKSPLRTSKTSASTSNLKSQNTRVSFKRFPSQHRLLRSEP